MSKLSELIKVRLEWLDESKFLEVEVPDGLIVVFTGEIADPEISREDFEEIIVQAANFLDKKISEVNLVGSKEYINSVALGDFIKVRAPVDFSTIITKMSDEFFGNEQDYKRIIDGLIRSELIARSTEGNFSLTYKGIIEVGTRKNRNSSDVRRLLATRRDNG